MKRSVGVSPSKRCAAARQHCPIPGACCKDAPRLQAAPTHASRPRAMGPKSRKGHRAPLFSLPSLGTKGGSSPEALAPSRRPLKPHGPAGGHEPTLVAGVLGGRGRLWAKRWRGPAPGLARCPPARTPKDAAEPQRATRVYPGSSTFPGRPPSLPFRALSGYTYRSRQSPDPQLCQALKQLVLPLYLLNCRVLCRVQGKEGKESRNEICVQTALLSKSPCDHGHHCASTEGPGSTLLGPSGGGELWLENCAQSAAQGPGMTRAQ